MEDRIKEQLAHVEGKLVQYRRNFHQYPEPAWTEFRTTSKIIHYLQEWGYQIRFGADVIAEEAMMGVPSKEKLEEEMERAIAQGADPELVAKMAGGKTGLVAELDCGEGPVIALRFDIDSNEIQEIESAEHRPYKEGFSSKNPGAMHACGHDGHITMGLGTAEVLASLKDQLHGKIRLIFQPGEEGVRGARAMVEAGVVDDVDYILGGHIGFKAGESGNFVCATGKFLATTKLDVTYKGVPSHAGAAPQEGKNALLAAACAALNLHAISRHGEGASRINVGVLNAGQGRNILPPNALMKLETRGETSEIDAYMVKESKRIAAAAAAMYDVEYDVQMVGGTSGGECDLEIAQIMKEEAAHIPAIKNVIDYAALGAAEDFAHLMSTVQAHGGKGCYYMLGADRAAGHHDNHFDFDESVLISGVEMNVRTVLRLAAK
ncbi:amidohydrolase [Rubeoparvulum massiliense]|uniref:amidohydrolase n=1 Tax=Rubeoparvulum massiliense TaxID=1631346 RepID=UPI000AC69466|nr:amidohydrolase [Rubeoparvulum massiliense]